MTVYLLVHQFMAQKSQVSSLLKKPSSLYWFAEIKLRLHLVMKCLFFALQKKDILNNCPGVCNFFTTLTNTNPEISEGIEIVRN